MKNLFVTAIGTDSGKTVISAILAKAYNLDYWKPVQSGLPDDSTTISQLTGGMVKTHPERYRLKTPASPHYAAEIDGISIQLDDFIPPKDEDLLIEGAGGLMVPINENDLMIDLIKKLKCDVLLVCNNYLGSINHSLLSLEALKSRGIKVKYLVFNGPSVPSSEKIIEQFCLAPVLFRLQQEEKMTMEVVNQYADAIRSI